MEFIRVLFRCCGGSEAECHSAAACCSGGSEAESLGTAGSNKPIVAVQDKNNEDLVKW